MKRLASFILAFIFLGSNLGLAMGTHFCGGHAMETAVLLGHEDLSCGMMPELPAHHNTHQHDQQIDSIPCCANEFQSLQIEDDFQNSLLKINVGQVAILSPLFSIDTVLDAPEDYPSSKIYSPPIRTGDVNILFQVFRI